MADERQTRASRLKFSRWVFLQSSAVLAASAPISGCLNYLPVRSDGATPALDYILRRDADEFFLKLTVISYRERRFLRHRWLQRISGATEPLLIFTFPPQHFAERDPASRPRDSSKSWNATERSSPYARSGWPISR